MVNLFGSALRGFVSEGVGVPQWFGVQNEAHDTPISKISHSLFSLKLSNMKTFSEVDNFFMMNLACIFGDSRRPSRPPPTQKFPLPKIDFIDVSDDFKLLLDFEKCSVFFFFLISGLETNLTRS